ncbi:MAG: hypothetical protein JNM57_07105 [Cyclobacteriaceae bacterium]|nr:hypothetical protein [Cyclobacteriaceae bacterium]
MNVKSLTQELIGNLFSVTEPPCISLYMPTHRIHPENMQDPIRFKNLVKQVKESLTEKYPDANIISLLAPFESLASDHDFWNHTGDGLCVLTSSELFEVIRLPLTVEELVIVAERFHTKPLRHILQSEDRYQVLALTMDALRLFEGNRHSLIEIELHDDVPATIKKALGEELTEKHTTVASYGGVGADSGNMHHGHGGKKDEVGSDTERFFRIVANGVYERYSKPHGLPLLLAALPEHHSLFNEVNKNPFLLPNGIEINPQAVSTEKLAELSWEVMQPIYVNKLEELAGKFLHAKSNGLGSDVMDEVIDAAEAGRVDTLFIEAHRVIAKRLRNKITGTFEMTDLTQPVLDDELDGVGELVSKMGGAVVFIPKEQMPTHTGLAAIFRY